MAERTRITFRSLPHAHSSIRLFRAEISEADVSFVFTSGQAIIAGCGTRTSPSRITARAEKSFPGHRDCRGRPAVRWAEYPRGRAGGRGATARLPLGVRAAECIRADRKSVV